MNLLSSKKTIDLLDLSDGAKGKLQPLGSFTFRIQQNPSDVDLNDRVPADQFIHRLQSHIIQLLRTPRVWFSDFKMGIDNRFTGDQSKIRWSVEDILRGSVNWFGKVFKMEDLLTEPTIKLDIITFTDDSRFQEGSAFYFIEDSKGNLINQAPDFMEKLIEGLKKQIVEFLPTKTFKGIKRAFSLARILKNEKWVNYLSQFIKSNLSRISQVIADIESIKLVVDRYQSGIPYEFLDKAIHSILFRLSTLYDLPINDTKMIEFASRYLAHPLTTSILDDWAHVLQDVMNNKAKEMLASTGFRGHKVSGLLTGGIVTRGFPFPMKQMHLQNVLNLLH